MIQMLLPSFELGSRNKVTSSTQGSKGVPQRSPPYRRTWPKRVGEASQKRGKTHLRTTMRNPNLSKIKTSNYCTLSSNLPCFSDSDSLGQVSLDIGFLIFPWHLGLGSRLRNSPGIEEIPML